MTKPSLTIVGLGVHPVDHLTAEAKNALSRSGVVHVIEAEALFRERYPTFDGPVESLDWIFDDHPSRVEALRAIADLLIERTRKTGSATLVTFGNPVVASAPVRWIGRLAKERGVALEIIPAVSALDLFWTDTGLDPTEPGLQIVRGEAIARLSDRLPCVVLSPGYGDDVRTATRLRAVARLVRDLGEKYGLPRRYFLYSRKGRNVQLTTAACTDLIELAAKPYLGDILVAGPVDLFPENIREISAADSRPEATAATGDLNDVAE